MNARRPTSRRRRRFGQHFLTDRRVLRRIVDHANLAPTDSVLEIGPGLGVLTRELVPRVAHVTAIELDPRMATEVERQAFDATKFDLVVADAAKLDYTALSPFNKVVANLPYSASSPITFRLLPLAWDTAILMYQLEFAQRLIAPPGDPEYGRLSAAAAYFARSRILQRVPMTAFHPPPDVDSAVVRLERHKKPPFDVHTPESYTELLRVLFSTRRKTIRSTLRRHHADLGLPSWEAVDARLQTTGVGERRPEELAPAELGRLDAALAEVRRGRP